MLRAVIASVITLLVSVPGTFVALDILSDDELPAGAIDRTIRSRVLGEDRRLIVHLPESYARDTDRRYPVVYVLDGSSQDIHTARTAALMARINDMPELIVVGLPNVSGEGRQRDYTPPFMARDEEQPDGARGEADRFLAFVKDDVMPLVDREYRTTPERLISGHSRGGLLVWYSLMADPNLFAARFAHSPALWRDDHVVINRMADFLAGRPDLATSLYLSMGSKENDKMMAGFDRAKAVLATARTASLRWHADLIHGADHQANGEMATPVGFKWFFAHENAVPAQARSGR